MLALLAYPYMLCFPRQRSKYRPSLHSTYQFCSLATQEVEIPCPMHIIITLTHLRGDSKESQCDKSAFLSPRQTDIGRHVLGDPGTDTGDWKPEIKPRIVLSIGNLEWNPEWNPEWHPDKQHGFEAVKAGTNPNWCLFRLSSRLIWLCGTKSNF